MKHVGIGLAGLVLLGCQTLPDQPVTRVDAELVLPELASRIEVASSQRFLFPGEFGPLPMPAFPEDGAEHDTLQLSVCLSFTVNEFGETTDIRLEQLPQRACAEPGAHQAFIDAAIQAVDGWEFIAAAICDYETPEQKADDDDTCGRAREITAIPVRLAWAFHFKAEGGRRSVEAGR